MERAPIIEHVQGQLELFEVRRFLGRTVFILDNLIQADFTPDEEPDDDAA